MKNVGKRIAVAKESNKRENSNKHGGKLKMAETIKKHNKTVMK